MATVDTLYNIQKGTNQDKGQTVASSWDKYRIQSALK